MEAPVLRAVEGADSTTGVVLSTVGDAEATTKAMAEKAFTAIEEVLSSVGDTKATAEAPSLINVEVVVLFEGGSLAGDHTEVSLPSGALELLAEVEATQATEKGF